MLTVTRLDRLARSTRDLLNTLAAITGKKAGFKSLRGVKFRGTDGAPEGTEKAISFNRVGTKRLIQSAEDYRWHVGRGVRQRSRTALGLVILNGR